LLSMRPRTNLAAMYAEHAEAPLRLRWLVAHGGVLVPLTFLSAVLYDNRMNA
jgi:hypothetical protein